MNVFIQQLSKLSLHHFGFFAGSEYLVCVSPYDRSVPPQKDLAYIDLYYEISNSQYHKTQELIAFCKKFGCTVAAERDKSYKDFLFENGFFSRGKNSLLQDTQFGSKIYLTLLKVTKLPVGDEKFGDKFASQEQFEEYFSKQGYSKTQASEIFKTGIRLEFIKFLQVLKSKQSRFKTADTNPCKGCNACVAACPQKAIPQNLQSCLRASMQEGRVEKSFSAALENRVLGCEICSEVCPKNRDIATTISNPYPLSTLLELVEKKDGTLCEKYGRNIISKNKLIPFILNAMGNSHNLEYVSQVEKYLSKDNEKIKMAAEIALEKLREGKNG